MKKILFVFSLILMLFIACEDPIDTDTLKKAKGGGAGLNLAVPKPDQKPEPVVVVPPVVAPGAFRGQSITELTEEHIPPGTTELQAGAFAYNNLRTLTNLPTSLKTIGSNVFERNIQLTEVVIPEGVTELGSRAFAGCIKLETLTLPNTLKTIGDEAFDATVGSSLHSLVLPEDLESIGARAFLYNRDLQKQITIPKTVTSIGDEAFQSTGITHVVLTEELWKKVKAVPGGFTSIFGVLARTYVDYDGNLLR